MDSDNDDGLFAIEVSSDEEATQKEEARAARTAQPESAFREVQASYVPKIENGEIWKSIGLPLSGKPSKFEALAVTQAIEELYFFRRYTEGAELAGKILAGRGGLDVETVKLVQDYRARCLQKATEQKP